MIEAYELKEAAPVLASLAIIELVLCTDRLLEVSERCEVIPDPFRRSSVFIGGLLADVARIAGLFVAAPIISKFAWAKILGALYLLHLMSARFVEKRHLNSPDSTTTWNRSNAVFRVAILDLTLSVGNIVAALSLTTTVWIVMASGVFWMIFTRLFANQLLGLARHLPSTSKSVPLLAGAIAVLLLVDLISGPMNLQKATDVTHLSGLIALLLLNSIYASAPPLQRALAPLFTKVGFPLMRAIDGVLSIVFSPLRAFLGGLKPR